MEKYKKPCTEKTEDYFVFSVSDEYPGAEIEERWIVASDLTEAQLLAKYTQLKKYQPYIALTMEQGRAIYECNLYEANLERVERRHCISLDAIGYEGAFYGRQEAKMLTYCEDPEDEQSSITIQKAFMRLTTEQQNLVDALFIKGMTQEEYARESGMSQSAISQNLRKIKNFLEKFLGFTYILAF